MAYYPTIERVCISVNTVCNLNCSYCYFSKQRDCQKNITSLSPKEISTILTNIMDYSINFNVNKKIKVNFVGSGEPLINWLAIQESLEDFWQKYPNQVRIKFYLVTNATLITNEIARQMQKLQIFPSVSLDGPVYMHDFHRKDHYGNGSFERVIKGIGILKDTGFDIAINTTITKLLLANLDDYIDFIVKEKFAKIIFDRLVDSPDSKDIISCKTYYEFLYNLHKKISQRKLSSIEIGNLESYKRSFLGMPDKVCTLFGSSCGAGLNFIIYLGREVYPCGRMFNQKRWQLGELKDSLDIFSNCMAKKLKARQDCLVCTMRNECVKDCMLEYYTHGYECDSRKSFLLKMKEVLL